MISSSRSGPVLTTTSEAESDGAAVALGEIMVAAETAIIAAAAPAVSFVALMTAMYTQFSRNVNLCLAERSRRFDEDRGTRKRHRGIRGGVRWLHEAQSSGEIRPRW